MAPTFRRLGILLTLATLFVGCASPFQPTVPDTVSSGAVSRVAGGPSLPWSPQVSFRAIGDMVVDAKSNIYLLDHIDIRKVAPDGTVTTVFEPDGEATKFPKRLALGPEGKIYVADSDAHALFRFEPGGEPEILAKSEDGSFTSPTSISSPSRLRVDSKGRIFMLDWDGNSASVIEVSPSGFMSSLFNPSGKGSTTLGDMSMPSEAEIVGLEVMKDDTVILIDKDANAYMRDADGKGRKVKLAVPKLTTPVPPEGSADQVEYRLDPKDRLVGFRDRYDSYQTLLIGQFFSSAEFGLAYKYLGFDVYRFDEKGALAKHHFIPHTPMGRAMDFDAKGNLYFDSDHEVSVLSL